ncbi:MAG: molybdopterin-dependent oxidoreductase [Chloroflexi bacterium]|nr:molybdopterin-dependent oxidoreductase [Chloroflexota bacterium]
MPDDVWIPSVCRVCPNCCGLKVHRKDGVIVKIEGNPDNPHNNGRICAKGMAHLMTLYDPNRVTRPLRRTNPEKGVGVDPRWQEIGWDEALDMVASRIKPVLADDPRKLVVFQGTGEADWVTATIGAFAEVCGTPNWSQGGFSGAHVTAHYLNNGAMHTEVDWARCRLLILFGSQKGGIAGHDNMRSALGLAEARARGMKLVVIDPICSPIASKANQWLPIRPGTDGALALSMLHVLLNELKVWDGPFLSTQTNAAYLVGSDGHYVRDAATRKPLVWDEAVGAARPFDDPNVQRPALDREYRVAGIACSPAFRKLRDHIAGYNPERVSEITTLPAAAIRSLAQEFAETASIGSTMVMEGQTLPFRPVCAFPDSRGATAHRDGLWTGTAIELLNVVVGSVDVPGGVISTNTVGPGGQPRISASPDGLLVTGSPEPQSEKPYPPKVPRAPQTVHMGEIFPAGRGSAQVMMGLSLLRQPSILPYHPEVLIINFANVMMVGIPHVLAQALPTIPFVVFMGDKLNETAELADVFIPIRHVLERLDFPMNSMRGWVTGDHWYYTLRQPVVEPAAGVPHIAETFQNVAQRLGLLGKLNERLNDRLELKGQYRLSDALTHTCDDILDRRMKTMFGEGKGLPWFKEHGLVSIPRSLVERFPRAVWGPQPRPLPEGEGRPLRTLPRFPIYFEFLMQAGQQTGALAGELGLKLDLSCFQPLPLWTGCTAHTGDPGDHDLFAVNYKLAYHMTSVTHANPWLTEVSDRHSYAYRVMINPDTAFRKGINDGDVVLVESTAGTSVKAEAKVSQCIHPEVVGIASCLGHWARGLPVAKGKGPHFNTLVPYGWDHLDMVSGQVDLCARVKVRKA